MTQHQKSDKNLTLRSWIRPSTPKKYDRDILSNSPHTRKKVDVSDRGSNTVGIFGFLVMANDIRNKQIYDLKRKGEPSRRIARRFGISRERVGRICNQLKKKEQQVKPTTFATALPPATRKVLNNYWGNNDIFVHPDIIADMGAHALSSVNRIGIKSLRKIAETLYRFEYIDDPDSWLAGKNIKEQ